ncbi:hypothetical protein GCM10009548_50070 [Streptomyces malaysiensis subsp. malaysiensis]
MHSVNTDGDRSVAIVGIGCRLPGGIHGPEALWRLLAEGREAPPDESVTRPWPGRLDPHDRLIEDVDAFDAGFFGIAPREADCMDPQHRLLLEVAYEALQDGGLPLVLGPHVSTGVFVGTSTEDYARVVASANRTDLLGWVGAARASAAARLSHHLRSAGPSLVLDTDRSSSLAAVHLAVRSLREGECDLALAGASNLILAAHTGTAFGAAGLLARDGRCRFGSAAASGFARAEAVVVVALKRLRDARAANDRIYAIIAGSAVNHDAGRSDDFLTPSAQAQCAVIRRACADAGIGVHELRYIEAHGTGTPVGDRVELSALAALPRYPAALRLTGSVKTNLGHTEAAAGLVGLVKTALMLDHRRLVPTLHTRPISSAVDPEAIELVADIRPWPDSDGPPYAGVSSFGLMGTNGHVVLTAMLTGWLAGPENHGRSADGRAGRQGVGHEDGPAHLIPLSARTPEALRTLRSAYVHMLKAADDPPELRDIAWTAACRRDHHPFRTVLTARSHDELLAALTRDDRGGEDSGDAETLVELTRRYEAGENIDWVAAQRPGRTVRLPAHPWLHGRHWVTDEQGSPRAGACPPTASSADDQDPEAWTRAQVTAAVAQVLGHVPDASLPLSDGGITSLMGLELRQILMESTGVELDTTFVYEHPTIDAVCRHILGRRARQPGTPQLDDDLDTALAMLQQHLGPDECERLLHAELRELTEERTHEENV